VVVGTYGIGKEKVFVEIAKALGCKACVERRKMTMLKMVSPELLPYLTLDKASTPLHVLPIFSLKRVGPTIANPRFCNRPTISLFLLSPKQHPICLSAPP
jgi:hypothetical protein